MTPGYWNEERKNSLFSIRMESSRLDNRTNFPAGFSNLATNKPWYLLVWQFMTVDEAYPPIPFVSSHSNERSLLKSVSFLNFMVFFILLRNKSKNKYWSSLQQTGCVVIQKASHLSSLHAFPSCHSRMFPTCHSRMHLSGIQVWTNGNDLTFLRRAQSPLSRR